MNEKDWTGLDGYPCTFAESETGKKLTAAILDLPCDSKMNRDDAEQKAHFLWRLREWARYDAQSALRPASQIASEKELRQLFDLCEKLVDHINSMHAPAVSALSGEGFFLWGLKKKLRETQEGARIAFGGVEGEKVRRRTPDVEASQVCQAAGKPSCRQPANH